MHTVFPRALAAVDETRRKRVERKQAEGGGVQQVSGMVLGFCIEDKVEARHKKHIFLASQSVHDNLVHE